MNVSILFLLGVVFHFSQSVASPLFEDSDSANSYLNKVKLDFEDEDGIELEKLLQITHSPLNEPAAESKRNFNLWSTLHLQKRDAESLNSSLPASNYSDTSTDDNDFDSKPTSPEPLLKSNSLDTNSANSDDHLNEPEDDEDSLKNSSSTDMTYYDYVFQVDNTTDGLNISLQKEESYVNSTTFSIQSSTAASDADLNDFQGNDYSNLGDKLDPEIDLNDEEDEEEESSLPFELQNLPRDIPKDYTIAEVLAENTLKDKHFDELRMEELIHELMTHTLGFGEIYSDEVEYDTNNT